MRKAIAILAVLMGSAGPAWIAPDAAFAQVQDQVVIVYGDDPCPANNGQEIVICRRAPRNEQFRIPKSLRESEVSPQAVGSNAVAAVQTTGGTGVQVQSCNAIGAGVNAGCLQKETDAWKAQQRADRQAEASIP